MLYFSFIELASSSVLHACLEHIEVTFGILSELIVATLL